MFFLKNLNAAITKRYPIVFIPGIFGSLGDDILEGTGNFDFGFAEFIYRPIIKTLKDMGYKEGKNLFISYYNWTMRNMDSATNYLIPTIEKAKEVTKSPKVDIVSHSMGGIVARSYAQSKLYNSDINKLIMIGTPNTGSAKAYYFWSGAEFASDEFPKNILYKVVRNSYMWYFKNKYKKKLNIEDIRRRFPSVEELLPDYNYGDYLFEDKLEKDKPIPIKDMHAKNNYLNKLNRNINILKRRKIRVYSIVGTNTETSKDIKVQKINSSIPLWQDGKPIEDIKTNLGDGTVICDSAGFLKDRLVYINSDHVEILKDCKYALSSILQTKISKTDKEESKTYNKIHNIIATDIEDISINMDDKDKYISNHQKFNSDQIISRKIGEDMYWIMIRCNDNIKVKLTSKKHSGEVNIYTNNMNTRKNENKKIKVTGNLKVFL